MEGLLHHLITGNKGQPPEGIERALTRKFSNPVNIEWYILADSYEAVFYKDKREYIARFNKNGVLTEYKVNRDIDGLPEEIRQTAAAKGEIMNGVSIHTTSGITYEVIYRDRQLKRYLILCDDTGRVITEKSL